MEKRMGSIWWVIALGSLVVDATEAATHVVGDDKGWSVPTAPTFYTTWASSKTFAPGDKLEFKWSGTHDVIEVKEDEYENCTKTGTPQNSSPVTITLEAAGSRYFICGVGPHCTLGQKLAVTVGSKNSTTPATPKGSASSSLANYALSAATLAIAIIFLNSR